MKKHTEKITHIIVREKDYTVPIFLGLIWTIIMVWFAIGVWFLIKSQTENIILPSVLATVMFCLGLYKGRDFFQPVETEEVIHVIKHKAL